MQILIKAKLWKRTEEASIFSQKERQLKTFFQKKIDRAYPF